MAEPARARIHPTISGPCVDYLRDLLAMGIYGSTLEEVAQELVREGVRRAIESGLLKARDFSKTAD